MNLVEHSGMSLLSTAMRGGCRSTKYATYHGKEFRGWEKVLALYRLERTFEVTKRSVDVMQKSEVRVLLPLR